MVDLETLLRESDIMTIHCPLTDETRDMIDAKELALMKPSAVVLNLARGGIINEMALHDALSRKTIKAAALDAFAQEPPPDEHPLFELDNILLTPHIGAVTREAADRGERGAVEEVVRVLEGKRPQNPVQERG